ncbi:MAG: preprotein translocase subunit SecY [Patescibacteria group bacterium]
MSVLQKVQQVFQVKDVRKSIIFVLVMLVVFRIGAHIPIPGITVGDLQQFFAQNQVLGLLNLFSGGGLENVSLMMLGLGPYITSSIIFQLLVMIVPRLEELQKDGEAGRQKINKWTRIATVPLALLQGYGFIRLFQQQSVHGQALIGDMNAMQWTTALIAVTAGTIFLMWIGELISEKNIGNGISLLIFAGIIAALPSTVQQLALVYDQSQLYNLLLMIGIGIVTVFGVVIITEGQRNIPISYARQVRGSKLYGGMSNHLPLRVNQGGVIPIIFAISVMLFPPMVAQFLIRASNPAIAGFAQNIIDWFNNTTIYGVIYFLLVVAFTFFYSAVVFHPDQIAENLQKQGAFIPGIRPGNSTTEYLQKVVNRINLTGSLFLGLIAVLPLIVEAITGFNALIIGGTSLLIIVSVVIEIVKQVEAQLNVHEYDAY